MTYILLLRGVNVGGKNKVKMEELKDQLTTLGFADIRSYINSGNLIFNAESEAAEVKGAIRQMLAENYAFNISFALINAADYQKALAALPSWWHDGSMARQDALFFTDDVDRAHVEERIKKMKLHSEIICFSDIAVFWGKTDEKEYAKTAYHKYLIAEDFYKKITIRNGNTVQKILTLLQN